MLRALNILYQKFLAAKNTSVATSRKSTLVSQIDFLIDTLHNNKLDIMYMEKLKMPLSHDEKVYFMQQVDRINSSIKILLWFRSNVCENESFWKKFFKWGNV